MSSMSGKCYLAWFVGMLSTQIAFACVPSRNVDIYFAFDSAEISAAEFRRLADWALEQRKNYPNQQAIYLDGYAEEVESAPRALARRRASEVERLLVQLRFNSIPMETSAAVYRTGDVSNGKRVEVSLLPACPNDCCR